MTDFIFPFGNKQLVFKNYDFLKELSFEDLIRDFKNNSSYFEIASYFTDDIETLKYRNGIFYELCNNEGFLKGLISVSESILNVLEVNKIREKGSSIERELYCVKELELYVECIENLYLIFDGRNVKSQGLSDMKNKIEEIRNDSEYISLKTEVKKLIKRISEIKSITLGVNLDVQLKALECGIVSINNESYKSGDIIDRLLRGKIQRDDFTCITPLSAVTKSTSKQEKDVLSFALINGINNVMKNSVFTLKPFIKKYILKKSKFLISFLNSINFYIIFSNYLLNLKNKGQKLCKPVIYGAEKGICDVKDLYNPFLCKKGVEKIISNDFCFDNNGKIFILTGANKGGKTVFLYSIGIMYVHLMLGLLLPCRQAEISVIKGVYINTASKQNDYSVRSRFEDECKKLGEYSKMLNSDSIFLYDEPLSGTSSLEAEEILVGLLASYSKKGFKGVVATHIHSVARDILKENEKLENISKFDNLSTVISNDERSFEIKRKTPDFKSYAIDIARKYGIDF